MYKDPLRVPSRALAVALAEEWESQAQFLDIRSLHLNNLLAKGVRAARDESLTNFMQHEILRILENDQIGFIEPVSPGSERYKVGLREA